MLLHVSPVEGAQHFDRPGSFRPARSLPKNRLEIALASREAANGVAVVNLMRTIQLVVPDR